MNGLRRPHNDDLDAIRRLVVEAAREALGVRPASDMVKMMGVPDGPEPAVSSAGVCRMILDNERLDRSDPYTAESFMENVTRTLDIELDQEKFAEFTRIANTDYSAMHELAEVGKAMTRRDLEGEGGRFYEVDGVLWCDTLLHSWKHHDAGWFTRQD
jgi:hypothetical protein